MADWTIAWHAISHSFRVWWDQPESIFIFVIAVLFLLTVGLFIAYLSAERQIEVMQVRLDRYSHRGRKLGEERKAKMEVERPWWERKDLG